MAGALYVIFGYIFLNIFLIIFITAINCRFKWNSWKNPFRTVWRARKVFKKPFWRIYIGPYHGGTYFHFESFFLSYMTQDLLWKDKYETPRFEYHPRIDIVLFKFHHIHIHLESPRTLVNVDDDDYYEQMIWFLDYCNSDIKKAKETWPYKKYSYEESTWPYKKYNSEESTWIDDIIKNNS